MAWVKKFEWIKQRNFDRVLDLWARRSPVGIEVGTHPLAEHILDICDAADIPNDGNKFIGPIEGRPLLSELYCGTMKAFNLNFHAQLMSSTGAYTNGSLYSFNSIIQIILGTLSLFGIFIVRLGGKYYVVDVFPWLGIAKEDRRLHKEFGDNWWQYGRIISDPSDTIGQQDIYRLFQRCLRVVVVPGWKEIIVKNLSSIETRWFNRPRNSIVYNFTGWTTNPDLMGSSEPNCLNAIELAAESIFDWQSQVDFGPLPQSLLLVMLLRQIWSQFAAVISIDLMGSQAPIFPAVGDNRLIDHFEKTFESILARAI